MLSLSPHLHTPFPQSLISLMVSVDVKHHVYLLILRTNYLPCGLILIDVLSNTQVFYTTASTKPADEHIDRSWWNLMVLRHVIIIGSAWFSPGQPHIA